MASAGANKISDFSYVTTIAGNGPTLGTRASDELGNEFMWVKQEGATSSAVGEWANCGTTGLVGYVSRTAASSLINAVSTVALCAGVFQSIIAQNSYGWIQISGVGVKALATTDGSVAAGDPLVIDGGATAVGASDTMADGEEESCCGFALAADVGTTQAAGTYTIRSVWM